MFGGFFAMVFLTHHEVFTGGAGVGGGVVTMDVVQV